MVRLQNVIGAKMPETSVWCGGSGLETDLDFRRGLGSPHVVQQHGQELGREAKMAPTTQIADVPTTQSPAALLVCLN